MDIDAHVNNIVQSIVSDLTVKVQAQVLDLITDKINAIIDNMDYSALLSEKLNQQLESKLATLPIDKNSIENVLTSRIENLAQNLSTNVQQQALDNINEAVAKQINKIDFLGLYQSSIISAIQNNQVEFPVNSISHKSLNLEGFSISGDAITGGIIKQFGSTGIDDKASNCQLTIMDDVTVVENNLLTRDLTVKGTVNIEGDLNVTGTVPEDSALFINVVNAVAHNVRSDLDAAVFRGYSTTVLNDLKENGLDLNKITIGGRDVIVDNTIGNFVVNSNLQKVGLLKELQVSGETFLGDTLYTSGKRVGVNTIEPNSVLSIWDQEVEVSVSKQSTNTAVIETPRNQTLVLSSNGKNNLSLNTDGSVSVNSLVINNIGVSNSDTPPTSNQPKGTIVFNSNPNLGGPIGWVSLGDAKWANFGIID